MYNNAIGPCNYKDVGALGCGLRSTPRSSTIVVPLNVPANSLKARQYEYPKRKIKIIYEYDRSILASKKVG